MSPRIVLVHAVQVAIPPVLQAFREEWPEATVANLLDDGLGPELERQGPGPAIDARIARLARHAVESGADGILFTCSAFGAAIDKAREEVAVPILKPNEAMFEQALDVGARLGMLATFRPSVPSMEEEFRQAAAARGSRATLRTVLVAEALDRHKAGDPETHDRLVADAAPQLAGCDAVLLAHFSTARARPLVLQRIDKPVLTSPGSAVARLRALVGA